MPSLLSSASSLALPTLLASTGEGGREISQQQSSSEPTATSSSSEDIKLMDAFVAAAADPAAGLLREDWPDEATATGGEVKLMSILSIVALARGGTQSLCVAEVAVTRSLSSSRCSSPEAGMKAGMAGEGVAAGGAGTGAGGGAEAGEGNEAGLRRDAGKGGVGAGKGDVGAGKGGIGVGGGAGADSGGIGMGGSGAG